ncbi:DMT family transporter [Pseudohalioglobus lutimaris]|uniref:EamA/RhaT family transporter n=1 Tax=Pseudohalioglobus lutimaris TaxID=1737061 RepID=A0A2N5X6P3_9GAMM|nr:DMT family transporter [Pseudohalioglobus lutimaris]PLW70149.1 EamA/RhaT family transporter [Pseudohalioglobus lutimaris]
MPQAEQTRQAIYLSLVMVSIASTAAVVTKYASAHASIEAIVTVQYLVCLLLCARVTLRPGLANLRSERLGLHLFRGAVGVLGFYLFYAALEHIPMVDAVLLRQSAPLTVPLVLWAWNREQVPNRALWPLAIGFIGVAVILRPSTAGLSWWHAGGFISALCLGISMVATHKLATSEPASRILFYYFFLSLACVAPFSLGDFGSLRWQDWAAMVYVGVAIYATLRLYTRAYAIAPAHAIAPVNYLAVVLAAFWGWLLWGQVPDRWSLLGSALVIAGAMLTLHLSRTAGKQPG